MAHQKSIIRSMKSVAFATLYTVAVLHSGAAVAAELKERTQRTWGDADIQYPCQEYASHPEKYSYPDGIKRACALYEIEFKNDCGFLPSSHHREHHGSEFGELKAPLVATYSDAKGESLYRTGDKLLEFTGGEFIESSFPWVYTELIALEDGIVVESIELQFDSMSCAVPKNQIDRINDDEDKFGNYYGEQGDALALTFSGRKNPKPSEISCSLVKNITSHERKRFELLKNKDWAAKKIEREMDKFYGHAKLAMRTNRGTCVFHDKRYEATEDKAYRKSQEELRRKKDEEERKERERISRERELEERRRIREKFRINEDDRRLEMEKMQKEAEENMRKFCELCAKNPNEYLCEHPERAVGKGNLSKFRELCARNSK